MSSNRSSKIFLVAKNKNGKSSMMNFDESEIKLVDNSSQQNTLKRKNSSRIVANSSKDIKRQISVIT